MPSIRIISQSLFGPGKEGDPELKPGSLRDSLKWLAFIVSVVSYAAGRFRSYLYVLHNVGDPASRTPTTETASAISGTILIVTLVLSLILGLLTVPRWQGLLSLAVVIWAIWMGLTP